MKNKIREFEFIFEKALAPNQGPRTNGLMKKNEGRKSCDTVPLMPLVLISQNEHKDEKTGIEYQNKKYKNIKNQFIGVYNNFYNKKFLTGITA
jgi:hypothetical protein